VSTIDQLLALDGIGQRAASFRFELLDKTNSFLGTLDIDSSSPPSVENNINRTIKRQLNNLKLPPKTTAEVNTLTERVRPVMVFQDGSSFSLGIFLFADASRSVKLYASGQEMSAAEFPHGNYTDATLVDQLMPLDQGTDGVTFYKPGTKVMDALNEQLEVSGVLEYTVDASDAKLADWMVWEAGGRRLEIINDLCALGSYYSLYFDNDGVGRIITVPNLETTDPDFVYDVNTTVYVDTIVESDDLLDAPNRYVVINSSFQDFPVWGVWDIPSNAPNSIQNRGFAVTRVDDVQGVESQQQAEAMAKSIGQADYSTYRWANFSAAPNPLHDTFNIVEWRGDKYREQGWSLELQEGAPMKHELRRVFAEVQGTLE
jgi:hypothetical protein